MLKKLWNIWQVRYGVTLMSLLLDGAIVASKAFDDYSLLVGIIIGTPGFIVLGDVCEKAVYYEEFRRK
jgi:hypothetical protein